MLRLCLLLLLAVLLPVRGAVAAAMMCTPASGAATASMTAHSSHHGAPADARAHAGHAQHHADASSSAHEDTPSQEKCTVCCDFCSMTPLLSALPSLPVPTGHASIDFPRLLAPAPSFLSSGPERPPRSI